MLLPILAFVLVLAICYCAYRLWQPEPVLALEAPVVERIKGLLPPLELKLVVSSANQWRSRPALADIEKHLKQLSAKHCGYFTFEQAQAKTQISLWLIQERVMVAVYEVQSKSTDTDVTLVVDLICRLKRGSLCVSSNMQAISQARPKAHPFVFQAGNDIKAMVSSLKKQLKLGYKPLVIEDAQRFFHWCHQELAIWAWQEPQLCSEYNRRLFRSLGIQPDKADYQSLIAMGLAHQKMREKNKLLETLERHPKISSDYWQRIKDQIIIIESDMSPDAVAQEVIALLNAPDHSQKHLLAGFVKNSQGDFNPFRAFTDLATHCQIRLKKLAALKGDKQFEVYLPLC